MKSIRFQRLVVLSASAVLVASAAAVCAQATASDGDKKFVEAALKGGMSEVDLGQLAVKKGASDDVKQFGQRMVDDHTKMGDQMKAVAGQIGVTPPSLTNPSDMALKAKLELLSGDSFDKAYISDMVSDHKKDIKEFKTEADEADDADLKNWVAKTVPVLEEHLRLAESAQTTISSAKSQTTAP